MSPDRLFGRVESARDQNGGLATQDYVGVHNSDLYCMYTHMDSGTMANSMHTERVVVF